MKLYDSQIRAAKSNDGKRRKLSDGHGLYLYVTDTSKTWIYRYSWRGKQLEITIGQYPLISLVEAREQRDSLRRLKINGIDPRSELNQQREAQPSFREVAEEFFETRTEWSSNHLRKTRNRVAKDTYTAFGKKPLKGVTTRDIVMVMRTVESRTIADSARKLLTAISQIFEFGKGCGYIDENPAKEVGLALRVPKKSGFNFVKNETHLGQVLLAIDALDCDPSLKALAQIQPLVWCRPGELRNTLWSEVDLQSSQIVIDKSRLKKGKENGDLIIPLSVQVVKILENLHTYTGHSPYVFLSNRRGKSDQRFKPLSDQALTKALAKIGISSSEQHPHGFRKTASTLLNELGVNKDWVEVQLHHVDQTIRGVYNKAIYLEQRHVMMQQYADLLDSFKRAALNGDQQK